MAAINWVHVFGIAPMLGYIVYRNLIEKKVLPEEFSIVLAIIVVVMFFFHLYRGITHGECKDE
jgi:uncharacterized membrane protein